MEIGTFGAVINAALELEAHLQKRYETQAANQADAVQAVYHSLAQGGKKRLKRLERIRREMVTEMILEPIHDLHLSADLGELATLSTDTSLSPEEARILENSAVAFYNVAAEKIGQAEAARALRRLGAENIKRVQQLQNATG